MKLGIMQPYFFPYIGYFQLIAAVDTFVVYDNIKYTKKGWINRNRFLLNGAAQTFSLPLAKASDYLDVCKRTLSPSFDKKRLLNQINGAYAKAPYFHDVFALFERVVLSPETNLFSYIFNSITAICDYLMINTPLVISSTIPIDHDLKSQDKVLAICESLGVDTYINPIGGLDLYKKSTFSAHSIILQFIRTQKIQYPQLNKPFVPQLSILDVMMFNSPHTIKELLNAYEKVD